MSHRICTLGAALILMVVGCSENDLSQNVIPTPPTTDEQIIADCHEIQAALEAFAVLHDGTFPASPQDIDTLEANLLRANRYTGHETEPRFVEVYWPGQIGVTLYYELDLPPQVRGYRITGRGANGVLVVLENIESVSPEALDVYETLLDEIDIIAAALEQFKAEAGQYPANVSDQTPLGHYFVDYFFPGGRLLVDPLSGYKVNPVTGNDLWVPGWIGYMGWDAASYGDINMYKLDAWAPNAGGPIAVRSSFSEDDQVTRWAMSQLQHAVTVFKAESGRFPGDVDLDVTSSGKTLLDLIPSDLTNVYTGAAMEPRNGLASLPGEIGYLPVIESDIVVGYIINGFGIVAEFERIEELP